MSKRIEDFFTFHSIVPHAPEESQAELDSIIETATSFSRLTYQGIYIIDYHKRAFDYVSSDTILLCGHTPEEVKHLGFHFYLSCVRDEDYALLCNFHKVGFGFFAELPKKDKQNYSVSYDFNLQQKDGTLILINHRITPIKLTDEGKIWKALCLVSLSNQSNVGNVMAFRHDKPFFWRYDLEQNAGRKSKKYIWIKWKSRSYIVLLEI